VTDALLAGAFGDERARAAAAVALDAVVESPVEIEAITRGNRKETAVARFPTRGPVVVQVATEAAWLRTEAALLRAIRERTFVPVPPVLTAGTHKGVAYMLTAYVAGNDLHAAFADFDCESQRAFARWFGRALARLHDAFSFDAYGQLELGEAGFTASQQDWEAWFVDYGTRAIDRLPAAFDDIADELRGLVVEAPDSDPTPRLFPWDFRPGNALVADGSVTAVLDWEAPLSAAPALSIAKAEYLVADWYVDDPAPLRAAFQAGYESVREMPAVGPAHRAVAIAASAVDSAGRVTNPRYPPVDREAAVAFHRKGLKSVLVSV
jgi:fructosamine-3-kinase